MAALKTKQTEANVEDFINSYADTVGKFKMGKGCIYVKKLEDINLDTLKKMINSTIKFLETKYEKH